MAVTVTANNTVVTATNVAFGGSNASGIASTASGAITATNVQDAIAQLAAQNFRSDSAPSGANVEQGDLWYDTNDDEFKIYREISTGNFQWVPIMIGPVDGDSDTLDAGSF